MEVSKDGKGQLEAARQTEGGRGPRLNRTSIPGTIPPFPLEGTADVERQGMAGNPEKKSHSESPGGAGC